MNPIAALRILLPLLFAVTVLPLLARFVMGRILFGRVRKAYLAPLEAGSLKTESDRKAYEAFRVFLKAKTGAAFPKKPSVKEDLDALILIFQDSYTKGKSGSKFAFSVSDLIKCAFLLMEELDSLLRGSPALSRLGGARISTLRRANTFGKLYEGLYEKVPFLKTLRTGRITAKAFRILLIPLIGIPSLAVSLTATLASFVTVEGPWRYYYAVLLSKAFQYGLILYGDRKGAIRDKLKGFSPSRIKRDAQTVEWILDPENASRRSPFYEEAFLLYQHALETMGVEGERDANFGGVVFRFNGKRRFLKKLLRIPLKAAENYNPFSGRENNERENLRRLVETVARPYGTGGRFYDRLRLIDLFDSLYMLSLLAYGRIVSGAFLLDNVSVDFVLSAKNLGDEILGEILRSRVPLIDRTYRSIRLYGKIRHIYKAVRAGNPVNAALSLTGPIVAESVMAGIREYVYRRVGRMTLYCFESNYLNRKRLF